MALNRCPNGHFYFGGKYRDCPVCKRRMKKLHDLDATYAAAAHTEDEMIKGWLESIGMLHMANKVFAVNIELPNGRKLTVHLFGKQNANDVLQVLEDNNILDKNGNYKFVNWPKANPAIGGFYHHVSAFACELNPQMVYVIEMQDIERHVYLYGCPSSKSLNYDGLMNRMTVEVIDYER